MPLSLQPLDDRHLPGMEEIVADPDALRFTRIPEPAPPGFAATWLGRYRGDETRRASRSRTSAARSSGWRSRRTSTATGREVELGYIVHPAARGRGVATQALVLLTRWAFDELGALRAYLFIDSENAASLKVAERAGYVREGGCAPCTSSRACVPTASCGRGYRATRSPRAAERVQNDVRFAAPAFVSPMCRWLRCATVLSTLRRSLPRLDRHGLYGRAWSIPALQ